MFLFANTLEAGVWETMNKQTWR